MKELYLIRHGASESNLRRLYLGRRDEPLSETGISQARQAALRAPEADCVFCIPGGESMAQLKSRVKRGFFRMLSLCSAPRAAAVVHGGTIMALLSALSPQPHRFYDGFTQNCGIVSCRWDGVSLTAVSR